MPKGVYPRKAKKIGASASDKAKDRCALFIAYCLAKKEGGENGMKQDGSALTRLEACMLGLWLMGGEKVMAFNAAELSISGVQVDSDGTMHRVKGFVQFAHGRAAQLVGEACGYGKPIDLLPWLTAHGITPPEVEG